MLKSLTRYPGRSAFVFAIIAGLVGAIIGAASAIQDYESSSATASSSCATVVKGDAKAQASAIERVEAAVGFKAKVPHALPIDGSELVFVNCSTGPDGVPDGLRYIELGYEDGEVVGLSGSVEKSIWYIQQLDIRLLNTDGDRVDTQIVDFEIYQSVLEKSASGEPFAAQYMFSARTVPS